MRRGLHIRPGERGAALLTVLLLVAVMGALTAAALGKVRLSTALAANGAALDQARAFAVGIEALTALKIGDILAATPDRTTLAGDWNGVARTMEMPGGGTAETTIRDGGNCFNINSVAQGTDLAALRSRPAGMNQLAGLMRVMGVPEASALQIAEAAGDWVDSDSNPNRQGGEDAAYADRVPPYRPSNTLFADVSELRAVAGMTPDIYRAIRPWLCALPTTDLSPINVNTLLPDQAPLLAMLGPEAISLDLARQLIAQRPASGWENLGDFYRMPAMERVVPLLPFDVQVQPQLATRWFRIELTIALQGAELSETALVDARELPARVVSRQWGSDD